MSAFGRVFVEQKYGNTGELRVDASAWIGEEILDAGFDTAGQAVGVLDQQAHDSATAATPVPAVTRTWPADPIAVGVDPDERPNLPAPCTRCGTAPQMPVAGSADGTDWQCRLNFRYL